MVQLISESIIEMEYNVDYLVMLNVAADIDEVRYVMLALMPRLHTTLVKGSARDARYIIPAKLNTADWTPCMKKQLKSGLTSVWQNVLVN